MTESAPQPRTTASNSPPDATDESLPMRADAEVAPRLIDQQSLERRRHIVDTRREELLRRGPDRIAMRTLAKLCGVSVPTLYRTFGSKEALLAEAIQPLVDSTEMAGKLANARVQGHRRLIRILELWVEDTPELGPHRQHLIGVFMATPSGRASLARRYRADAETLGEVLDQMKELGELAEWADPRVVTRRLTAQAMLAAFETSGGSSHPGRWRDDFFTTTALIMAGATEGEARIAFTRLAARHQHASERPRH